MTEPSIDDLRGEVAALRAELAALRRERPVLTGSAGEDGQLTRRGLLARIGTAAAAGAGALAAGTALADPAAANTGDAMILGGDNHAGQTTYVDNCFEADFDSSGSNYTIRATGYGGASVQSLNNQTSVFGGSWQADGVTGHSSLASGVVGHTLQNSAYGVVGANANLDNAPVPDFPAGVGGVATNGVAGVCGTSDSGNGVVGTSASGVGVLASTGTGSAALYAYTPGKGHALQAKIGNSASKNSALAASTTGAGPAVLASSTSGLGASFAGGQAAIRLVPRSGTGHPTSGAHLAGELVVDSAGALFICITGGSPGTWRRVTVS